MSANKTDIKYFKFIFHGNDQAIFVSANVKYNPFVSDETGRSVDSLDLMRVRPISFFNFRIPGSKRLLGIAISRVAPEIL